MLIGNEISRTEAALSLDKKDITLADLVAYTLQQKSQFDGEALKIVNGILDEHGKNVSVLYRIYNASGADLTFVTKQEWDGSHIWKYPCDQTIKNGQWSVVLAAADGFLTDCCTALVYRRAGSDLFLGARTPYIGSNSVHVECREQNHWPNVGSWSYMKDRIWKASEHAQDRQRNLLVTGNIGGAAKWPLLDLTIQAV